jgi:hypothetical protein
MDKLIIDIVSDFAAWKGDTYRLAALISEAQKQLDVERLVAAEMPEAAEIVST